MTSDQIKKATAEFLSRGGKVQQLQPAVVPTGSVFPESAFTMRLGAVFTEPVGAASSEDSEYGYWTKLNQALDKALKKK